MKTFVFSDDVALLFEMISFSRQFGTVNAIVVDNLALAKEAAAYGADILLLNGTSALLDDYVPAIITALKNESPDLFLVSSTVKGKLVAGRAAAQLDTDAVASVKDVKEIDGTVCAVQMIYGGGAIRLRKSKTTLIALVKTGLTEAKFADTAGSIVSCTPMIPENGIRLKEIRERPASNDGILTASRVVGVGSGFESNEHINIARDLASALGGEVGYSRPLIEGDPPVVPNEPYIGVTGIQIKPDLYIAVGISGQTQHVVGINESKVVACINKDPNALMFRHSDYGIVGDLNEVLPALTEAIRTL